MTDQAPDSELSTADLVDRYGEAVASIPVKFRSFGRKTPHRSTGSPTIRVWALPGPRGSAELTSERHRAAALTRHGS